MWKSILILRQQQVLRSLNFCQASSFVPNLECIIINYHKLFTCFFPLISPLLRIIFKCKKENTSLMMIFYPTKKSFIYLKNKILNKKIVKKTGPTINIQQKRLPRGTYPSPTKTL